MKGRERKELYAMKVEEWWTSGWSGSLCYGRGRWSGGEKRKHVGSVVWRIEMEQGKAERGHEAENMATHDRLKIQALAPAENVATHHRLKIQAPAPLTKH